MLPLKCIEDEPIDDEEYKLVNCDPTEKTIANDYVKVQDVVCTKVHIEIITLDREIADVHI